MTLGWILVYLGVLALNLYAGYRYFRIPYKTGKKQKIRGMLAVHLILAILCLIYFILFFQGKTGGRIMRVLSYEAAFYLGTLFYASLLFVICDLIRLALRRILPEPLRRTARRIYYGGLTVIGLSMVLALAGIAGAARTTVTKYELTLPRRESRLTSLKAVLISDLHLGAARDLADAEALVSRINGMHPDAVFLAGDMTDEGTPEKSYGELAETLGRLSAPYGVYYIPGNHEYKAGQAARFMEILKENGVRVLSDETERREGLFYVAGRVDKEGDRAALSEVLAGAGEDLPVILLDHRPACSEARESGRVDLQLSGHTHNGQMAPMKPFSDWIGMASYGAYTWKDFSLIVTSGCGMFGFPLRIGSENEIVELQIQFQ
jgi:predicted MPP superfamily phosphohydrolase